MKEGLQAVGVAVWAKETPRQAATAAVDTAPFDGNYDERIYRPILLMLCQLYVSFRPQDTCISPQNRESMVKPQELLLTCTTL